MAEQLLYTFLILFFPIVVVAILSLTNFFKYYGERYLNGNAYLDAIICVFYFIAAIQALYLVWL